MSRSPRPADIPVSTRPKRKLERGQRVSGRCRWSRPRSGCQRAIPSRRAWPAQADSTGRGPRGAGRSEARDRSSAGNRRRVLPYWSRGEPTPLRQRFEQSPVSSFQVSAAFRVWDKGLSNPHHASRGCQQVSRFPMLRAPPCERGFDRFRYLDGATQYVCSQLVPPCVGCRASGQRDCAGDIST